MENFKQYFKHTQEEKDKIIETVTNNLLTKSDYLSNELRTNFDNVWTFYKNNFKETKKKALKEENYELCEIIDKVILKMEDNANTRKKTD